MLAVISKNIIYSKELIADLISARPDLKLGRYTGWEHIDEAAKLRSLIGTKTNPLEVVILRTPPDFWKKSARGINYREHYLADIKNGYIVDKTEEYMKDARRAFDRVRNKPQ